MTLVPQLPQLQSQTAHWTVYIYSSGSESDGGEVRQVQVSDTGSQSQSVVVDIEGVPARGSVDTGSDITIIGGQLF